MSALRRLVLACDNSKNPSKTSLNFSNVRFTALLPRVESNLACTMKSSGGKRSSYTQSTPSYSPTIFAAKWANILRVKLICISRVAGGADVITLRAAVNSFYCFVSPHSATGIDLPGTVAAFEGKSPAISLLTPDVCTRAI